MYLGHKGLTIPKQLLSESEQKQLKKDLTITPKNIYQILPPFYIYRESPNKFYTPRFYKSDIVPSQLSQGISIQIPFIGQIRDTQQLAIDAFMATKCGLLQLPCGFGKTILALYLIHVLGKKTLVIVHKEFLMDQWIERIQEFLPTAKIGKIQGTTIDITGKDIVLGMLQSLSTKEYSPQIFKEFGFTIIDETHHMGAEVFSNALFQVVTPYMLGLSATMERKDGMTKIFKMFLGEVLYSAQREISTNIVVQMVKYQVHDAEFNETILNFKGQANYSSMIKKICEYNSRTEFILTVLTHILKDPTRQIMILAHNKSILTYLYDAIQHRKLASVGYYIGGMVATDLKETESKRVVIATYAMAEEALDIKSLNTLIMASPKTDVTQAVGRILREKHGQPLIVDIVDSHDTFGRQWAKRKKYYVSQKYSIVQSSNLTYPTCEPIKERKEKSKCLITL
jgi:superfamily II DNA or RNA helicase